MLHLYEKITRNFRGDKMTKKITLACAICSSRNYTTSKNVSTKVSRMEVRKYCKTCGQHTDRKSTRLNSSHVKNSYAVFCLKKRTTIKLASNVSSFVPSLIPVKTSGIIMGATIPAGTAIAIWIFAAALISATTKTNQTNDKT